MNIRTLQWVIAMTLLALPTRGEYEKSILVHGHRGSRGTHPENSIPAFEEAIKAGAEVLELDLQLSRDNVPVIWHDAIISPKHCHKLGSWKSTPIRELSIPQIKQFDCGYIFQANFPEQKLIPGLKIQTLDEFFKWIEGDGRKAEGIQFNIETKMDANAVNADEFVRLVVGILRKARVVNRTILQSFDFRTLRAAKKIEPTLRLSALFDAQADYCRVVRELGAQIFSPRFKLLTKEIVNECHAQGIRIVPWTLNSDHEWSISISMGVDGIISDYPRRLKNFLKGNV